MKLFVKIAIAVSVCCVTIPLIYHFSKPVSVYAAGQQTRCAKIVAEGDEPVIGATVMVKGSSIGSVSDIDGRVCITANPGDIIVVSYIGYVSVEIPFSSFGDEVSLTEDI